MEPGSPVAGTASPDQALPMEMVKPFTTGLIPAMEEAPHPQEVKSTTLPVSSTIMAQQLEVAFQNMLLPQ